jgi:hypothetical protein
MDWCGGGGSGDCLKDERPALGWRALGGQVLGGKAGLGQARVDPINRVRGSEVRLGMERWGTAGETRCAGVARRDQVGHGLAGLGRASQGEV